MCWQFHVWWIHQKYWHHSAENNTGNSADIHQTGTDGKTGPILEKAFGAHINGPGHKVSDMSVTILEKVWNEDPMFLAVREDYWINKMNTKHKGMNKNRGS